MGFLINARIFPPFSFFCEMFVPAARNSENEDEDKNSIINLIYEITNVYSEVDVLHIEV